MISEIENNLIQYALNPEDPEINFSMALCYDNINQIASAITHYIRCAERTEDKLLQYECMLRGGLAIKRQGSRLHTEKSFFHNAICTLPQRPEAYMFMADTVFKMQSQHQAYMLACIAESLETNNYASLRARIPYNGMFEIKMKKLMYGKKCGIETYSGDLEFLNDLKISFN
jgi:thioredoxin-like negative regulator of GroEL